jgi:hypothetical protein
MTYRTNKIFLGLLPIFIVLNALPLIAGGPFYVTGPLATQPGQPYRWESNTIQYHTDRGGLGNQTNAEANQLVAEAFQIWQDVDTANISFQQAGELDVDITASNITTFENEIGNCSDMSQPQSSVIYDLDGSILTALGYDYNSIVGFAALICSDDESGFYTRGYSLLNGRLIDGQPNTPGHTSISLEEFRAAFIHEFGHLIGLGHSQVNLNCLTDLYCTDAEYAGVPVMFPILLNPPQTALTIDDRSSVSMLYPSSSFGTSTGRIQGRVVFSDGRTPAQGYNVIARGVSDPSTTAVSSVSGYLFTAADGNELVPGFQDTYVYFGSRNQDLIGYYDIAGLPPGEYTVEVEAINNSGSYPFIFDSGVGPIGDYLGFQYKMPGACDVQYLHSPPSHDDTCTTQSILVIEAGGEVVTDNTDVVLIGTPPRYDAWEDGP